MATSLCYLKSLLKNSSENGIGACLQVFLLVYEFKLSLELSLAPYVQVYRTSTVLFFVAQLTIWAILVGSWWPAALGLYQLSWCQCEPTKYTSPNCRSWAMLPPCGFALFFNLAICGALPRRSKNVPNQNVWEKG
jgi:hypothetical protein